MCDEVLIDRRSLPLYTEDEVVGPAFVRNTILRRFVCFWSVSALKKCPVMKWPHTAEGSRGLPKLVFLIAIGGLLFILGGYLDTRGSPFLQTLTPLAAQQVTYTTSNPS